MFASPDRLEADEGYLHGEQQADDVEHRVADEETLGEAAHDQQQEHMERDQVDDEHVTTPCWYL